MNGWLSYQRALPMIFQSEMNECSLACLAMISGFHGCQRDIGELRSSCASPASGSSLRQLLGAADQLALHGRVLRLELREIPQLALPAILHWDMDHFVVLKRCRRGKIIIHDPAIGVRTYPIDEVSIHFTGIAIELAPTHAFRPQPAAAALRLPQLLQGLPGIGAAAAQVLALSMLLQLMALTTPLYLQLVIDQGLQRGNMGLVAMAALAFVLVLLLRQLLGWGRGILLLRLSNRLASHLVGTTLRQVLNLPLGYFQRRQLGDIISRFSSLETIKQHLTQEALSVMVDGLFSLVALALLFYYSALLAWLALAFALLFILVRLASLPREQRLRGETLVAEARAQSCLTENIAGIQTLRVNGIEREREAQWQNRYVGFLNAGQRLAGQQLGVGLGQGLVSGLDNIAAIYLAATLVDAGSLSLGQMISALFLKQHFSAALFAMVPALAHYRLIRAELERVGDLLQAPQETAPQVTGVGLRGGFQARKLCFRYDQGGPCLLRDLDFRIEPGEAVVISGRPGTGKSTLLKLLLGLEQPLSGELLIDGAPASGERLGRLSNQIAAVLQGDRLLSGDIAYNINLGREPGDLDRLSQAAQLAGLTPVIEGLPLGLHTPVGDLHCLLSAGQQQRLLIARALYRNSRVLLLDEALSQLGPDDGAELLRRISCRGITVVYVSHDPALTAIADRQIRLG